MISRSRLFNTIVFLCVVGLLSIVTWVYFKNQVDYKTHNQQLAQIIQIQQNTSRLIEKILLLENGDMLNFDEIAKLENAVAEARPEIKRTIQESEALINEIDLILDSVSQIKATYAIYQNSLLYFPKGVALLKDELEPHALMEKLSDLDRAILLFALYNNNSTSLRQLEKDIADIKKSSGQLPPIQADKVERLLRHAAVFIQYTNRLKSLNSQLLNNQLFHLSKQLIADFSVKFQQQVDKAALIRQLFFATICGLVLVVLSIWSRQVKTLYKLNKNVKSLHFANQAARQGLFEIDFQSNKIKISADCALSLGYSGNDRYLSIEKFIQNIHPDDRARFSEMLDDCRQTGQDFKLEFRKKNKEGRWLWFYSSGEIISRDKKHKPLKMIGIHADISRRKQSEEILRMLAETGSNSSEQLFKKIVSRLAQTYNIRYAMISVLNVDDPEIVDILACWGRGHFINKRNFSLKNTPCEKVIKENSCFVASQLQQQFPDFAELAEMQAESFLGVQLKDSQANVIGAISLIDDQPIKNPSLMMVLLQSIASRVSMELERLKTDRKLELAAHVFSDTQEGITITDLNGNIVDVNPAFCRITGYERDEVLGRNPRFLNSGKQDKQYYADMWKTLKEKGHWKGEIWNRKKDGSLFVELLTISAVKDAQGQTSNYIGIFLDITANKEQQKHLEIMAHYDVLTKLPNRALFYDRFQQAMAHSKRSGDLLAICFLDLDNFKPVNDTYGHNVGDQLLIEVAERIKANIREEDTVSRQGGDEFTLLLSGFESVNGCERIIERILNSLVEPYWIEGNKIEISASLGVTLYPEDCSDIDTLIRHADQAMYQAKLLGKNCYQLFNAKLNQQHSDKQQRLGEIRQALSNQEFCLYYQPKVNMASGQVYGAEALIRWRHPEKGIIPPFDFLPVIEETPLEIQLGEWVIEQALKQMDHWLEQELKLEISVNIASFHLHSPEFINRLDEILAKYPTVDSSCLQLEILESSALGDVQIMNHVVTKCQKELGVKVALDDFGTGYSSLTHLRNLPAETIKIDQTFIRDVLDDGNDYNIIDGIIGLAESFDREVIAEGVETTEHGLILLIMGCQNAQGYGIAKPMPATDVPKWIKNYRLNQRWFEFSQQNLTRRQKRTIQLKMIIEHWWRRFEICIRSKTDERPDWPIMNEERCLCGYWIKREKQEVLFNPGWLNELESAHHAMHQIAKSIKNIYLTKGQENAQRYLSTLENKMDEIDSLLKQEYDSKTS